MKKILAVLTAILTLLAPLCAFAEGAAQTVTETVTETAVETAGSGIHLDGAAFADSLQYMLKGMVGIFLVTAIIILAVLILEKTTGKKKDESEN